MSDVQPPVKLLSQEVNLRNTLIVLEIAIAGLLLVLFSEGFVTRLIAPEQEVEGSTILRLMWLPAYGFVAILALMNARRFGQVILRSPFLIALIALASVSCLWSIDPALSFRRGIAISFTTLFGLYLAARFNWRELLILFGGVWFFLAIASLVAGALFPDFARMSEIHVGAWRGMWWEKNAMGGHMARAGFIMMFLAVVDTRRRPFWVIGIMLTVALVLLSTSKTALVGTLVGALVIVVGGWMRRGPITALSIGWAGVSLAGSVLLALVIAPEAVFGLLGRDATLTGRTDIWSALVTAIAERPWLGYGYGAFWPADSEPAYWIRKIVDWPAPTAHNGWLDTWLSIGLLGVGLFALNFVIALVRAFTRAVQGWSGIFAIGFMAQFALFSMSESIVLQQNAIIWVLYSAIIGRLAMDAYDRTDESAQFRRIARPIFEARRPVKTKVRPPD